MKKLIILALLGVFVITGFSYSQELPDGVKKIMDQLQNDPDADFGFNDAKKSGFINKNVLFQNWFVGLPLQLCNLDWNKIDSFSDSSNFRDLIEPINYWRIPVKINNKSYEYCIEVKKDNENSFRSFGSMEGPLWFPKLKIWDKFRKKFPEESGIVPYFSDIPLGILYIPQVKNGKNIFKVKNSTWSDPISKATSNSFDSLDDAKTIIPLLKNKIKEYRKDSKRLKNLKEKANSSNKDLKNKKEGNK